MFRTLKAILTMLVGGLVAVLAPCVAIHAQEASTLVRNATVFDGTGRQPFQSDILIKNGRITAIAQNIVPPEPNTEIVDASGLVLLPGLIDVHVHWTSARQMTRASIARTLLQHGVTTVTDFHSAPESYGPKRLFHTQFSTPHVLYIARTSSPGGHGSGWGDENMTRSIVVPGEAEYVVDKLRPYKPDAIKVFTDGWRYGSGINNTSMNENALAAIVAEVGKMGVPVLTHTLTVDRAKQAARSKVNAIVHAIQNDTADEELVSLMLENDVFYAPTLAVYEPRMDNLANASKAVLARVRDRQAFSQKNLLTFNQNGVKVALGTDSGIGSTRFGESTLRELELLVGFGLSPTEALVAGTAHSAGALNLLHDRGTISVGKRADLLLVKGKPWEQISDIRNIQGVFVDGVSVVAQGEFIGTKGPDKPSATIASGLIDDFESEDGKTASGAVRLRRTDRGHPRSTMIVQSVLTESSGRILDISAEMAVKADPSAYVELPLSPGSFTPNTVDGFSGIRFDARGEGDYEIQIVTGIGTYTALFKAGIRWAAKQVEFTQFRSPSEQAPSGLEAAYSVRVGGSRNAGEKYWLQIDNVEFY